MLGEAKRLFRDADAVKRLCSTDSESTGADVLALTHVPELAR